MDYKSGKGVDFMKKPSIFDKSGENSWCPGCGNFGILDALKTALENAQLTPEQVLFVSGIGQAAKLPHYISGNGFNGLHGRALPAALGAHVANHTMKIIVNGGDGDSFGEGGNHWIHAMRRNVDLVHLVHDNQVYGLTKGQGSPTTPVGQVTTLQMDGVRTEPLHPLAVAISLECNFVARAFSGDQPHLTSLIEAAMKHPGYALIDILQPCVTFNKVNTFQWYKQHTFYLPEDYDPTNQAEALQLASQWGDEGIPLGILYTNNKPSYHSRLDHLKDDHEHIPLFKRPRSPKDIEKLLG